MNTSCITPPVPGTRVRVLQNEKKGEHVSTVEGTLLPSHSPDSVVLKLDSGYNIGILLKNIKDIQEIDAPKMKAPERAQAHGKARSEAAKENKLLPTISILHTGGTIASKVDYETGGVIARYDPVEIVNMFPELKDIATIRSRLIRNMWSEDMRFAHYNLLAEEIENEVKAGANGIIITHGTDTLHYTSAALSFMLTNLPVPVIIVGSQRSSDRGSSDSALNLLSTAFFIAHHPDFADVGVCMHESSNDQACTILPGTKCRKLHSSRRDAFKAVNAVPWARVDFHAGKVEIIEGSYRKAEVGKSRESISFRKFNAAVRVGLLKIHPNLSAEEVGFYKGYDGLIVEGFGIAGHVPINETDEFTKENGRIAKEIKNLTEAGTLVAATTQAIYGVVDMDVYSTGRKMQELGMLGNGTDMTTETAFVKMAWLLSNFTKQEAREMYGKNLAGELRERIPYA